MIRTTGIIILQSGINPDMGIVIAPFFSDLNKILDLEYWANYYYTHWLGGGDDDELNYSAIGDYIQDKLEEHGYVHNQNYEMYFSANWENEPWEK